MILYKYISLDTARRILTSTRIGFSRPSFFNDPFDTPVAIPGQSENPIDNINARIKSRIWEQETAILSLTRSPTNMLMWAHYADSHRGAVLEIDAEVAGFVDERKNMIPAQFGSVIYARSRPTGPYLSTFNEGVIVGATHRFVLNHYEKWQRLFLTKPLEWAYEEEVRVAKCLSGLNLDGNSSNDSGNCTVINLQGRPLHCFEFPKSAISRVFTGAKARKGADEELENEFPDISIHRAKLSETSFNIGFIPPLH